MEYVFICYAGMNRSPVAADVARNLADKYNIKGFSAISCGIAGLFSINSDSVRKRLNMADVIFALDLEIADDLIKNGISPQKIHNLDIEDIYPIREYPELRKELEGILIEKLEPFFVKGLCVN